MSADINFIDEILRNMEKDANFWINKSEHNFVRLGCHCEYMIKIENVIIDNLKYCSKCQGCIVRFFVAEYNESWIYSVVSTQIPGTLNIYFYPAEQSLYNTINIERNNDVFHAISKINSKTWNNLYNIQDIFSYFETEKSNMQNIKWKIDNYYQTIPTYTIQYMLDHINPNKQNNQIIIEI